jgi:hypothetical protein
LTMTTTQIAIINLRVFLAYANEPRAEAALGGLIESLTGANGDSLDEIQQEIQAWVSLLSYHMAVLEEGPCDDSEKWEIEMRITSAALSALRVIG